jgi:hypothetical protein
MKISAKCRVGDLIGRLAASVLYREIQNKIPFSNIKSTVFLLIANDFKSVLTLCYYNSDRGLSDT